MVNVNHVSLEGILGFPVTPFDDNDKVDDRVYAGNVREAGSAAECNRIFTKACLAATKPGCRRSIYREVLLPIHHFRQLRKGYAGSLIKTGMDIIGPPAVRQCGPRSSRSRKEHYARLEDIVRRSIELFGDSKLS